MSSSPSESVRFPAWAGTAQELEDTIDALHTRVLPSGRLSVTIRSLRGLERSIPLKELANELPKKEPFQIVVESDRSPNQDLLVVLGHDLPAPTIDGDDDSDIEEIPGNTITVVAATSAEAMELANRALGVVRAGMPGWAGLKQRGHMSVMRLDNLTGLILVAVGLLAGLIVVWPIGWFFGLFISLALLLAGSGVVENLFPPFEVHQGRPRWRRRWFEVALLVGIPLGLSVVLRVLLGPWDAAR